MATVEKSRRLHMYCWGTIYVDPNGNSIICDKCGRLPWYEFTIDRESAFELIIAEAAAKAHTKIQAP